jgi:hypothetical protein
MQRLTLLASIRQQHMIPGSDVSAEFQRRRMQTWRAVRWWLLPAVIAGVAFAWRRHVFLPHRGRFEPNDLSEM